MSRKNPGGGALETIAARLAPEVIAGIDAVTNELLAATPGLTLARSDVVRLLISEALVARGRLDRGDKGRARRGRRRP